MKRSFLLAALAITSLLSCKKENKGDKITLTASTTTATIGQEVTFQVATEKSAVKWSVNPATTATSLYTITNAKNNVISFSQVGDYIVSVRSRNVLIDTLVSHNLDSLWNSHAQEPNGGNHDGEHHNGEQHRCDSDSAFVKISVVK